MAVIFLVGARGSGKTTMGKSLARELGCGFIDLDGELLRRTDLSVADIVAREGWGGFRLREKECLKDVLGGIKNSQVVATGGGIVLDEENRDILRRSGLVLWLRGSPELLHGRLERNPLPGQRPALSNLDSFSEMCETLKMREPYYAECAHHALDASLAIPELCRIAKAHLKAHKAPRRKSHASS